MYKQVVRPLFFSFDPEKIHHFTFSLIKYSCKIPLVSQLFKKLYVLEDPRLQTQVLGLTFKSPVGLAAGFDKDAKLYKELSNFGFGFIEIGTLTPKAQQGNPKKRLFRLPKDKALINRMGFNNQGVVAATKRLKHRNPDFIIGGNIGKNTDTPAQNYTQDYTFCFTELHPYVDYFVVNVSCPNVGSHAKLQEKGYLIELLNALQAINKKQAKPKPIVLKIAPDLNNQQLDEIIAVVAQTGIDGVIASNTSMDRSALQTDAKTLEAIGNGGLSGKPVTQKSTDTIAYLHQKSNGAFPIIGVGGIHSAQDALDKLQAGASLVQVYTGFIYEGPSLLRKINKAILKNK